MKNQPDFKMTFVYIAFLTATFVFGIAACNNKTETTSTEEEVVEVQNESNLEHADTTKANDAQFLVEAANINHQEIAMGQLAQKNTKTPETLVLAKMMIEDHSKALDEVKALADKKSITVPSASSESGQSSFDKLSSLKGKEFDKAYADEMVNGHKMAIEKFETVSKNSNDEEVKGFANSMLPKLRMHLEHSQECQKKTAPL